MATGQMRATGGRRIRPGYIEEINARKRFLPQLYSLKSANKYRDELQKQTDRSLGIQEDVFDLNKKRAKTARNIGYTGLGIQGGLGLIGAYPELKDIGSDIIDFVTPSADIAPDVAGDIAGAAGFSGADFGDFGFGDFLTEGVSPALRFAGGAAQGLFDNIGDSIIDIDFDDAFSDLF